MRPISVQKVLRHLTDRPIDMGSWQCDWRRLMNHDRCPDTCPSKQACQEAGARVWDMRRKGLV
jgi:hypothetical protein